MVYGSRYEIGEGIFKWNIFRKLTSRMANFVTCKLWELMYRIYKRKTFQNLIPNVEYTGFGFQMEIMVRAGWGNSKVGSVSVVFVDRIWQVQVGFQSDLFILKGHLEIGEYRKNFEILNLRFKILKWIFGKNGKISGKGL